MRSATRWRWREIGDEEGITKDESAGAKILSGNKEILALVTKGVEVSVTQKEDMIKNILCSQSVT